MSMQEKEVVLMKGNEAIAHAAIRCGCDGYFGYPITPQSEVIELVCRWCRLRVSWLRFTWSMAPQVLVSVR